MWKVKRSRTKWETTFRWPFHLQSTQPPETTRKKRLTISTKPQFNMEEEKRIDRIFGMYMIEVHLLSRTRITASNSLSTSTSAKFEDLLSSAKLTELQERKRLAGLSKSQQKDNKVLNILNYSVPPTEAFQTTPVRGHCTHRKHHQPRTISSGTM
jgi:hypothetical protein